MHQNLAHEISGRPDWIVAEFAKAPVASLLAERASLELKRVKLACCRRTTRILPQTPSRPGTVHPSLVGSIRVMTRPQVAEMGQDRASVFGAPVARQLSGRALEELLDAKLHG